MNRWLRIAAAVFVAGGCNLFAVTYYVAGDGNDANPGTRDLPFHSLERARDQVRRLGTNSENVSVIVRDGLYFRNASLVLNQLDSRPAPVTWTAETEGKVRLCGGVVIPADAFTAVTNPAVLSRLDPSARHGIVQADLFALGITDLGRYADIFRGAPLAPELFFNAQRQHVARWPNDGWATIAQIIERGTNGLHPATFEYSGDRPAHWDLASGVWLSGFWCYDWYDETVRVGAIDSQQHQIRLKETPHYGIWQGNPGPRRYRAQNLLEELDEPGEYYINTTSSILYFWPPASLAGAEVILSALKGPLFKLDNASHIVLRGFTMEDGLGDGIDVLGGGSNCISACEIRNFRELGIRVSDGIGHRVTGCNIHDTGRGGIILSGGDRKTLTPAGLVAVNNRIWGFSQHQLTYASGIQLAGVGNEAAHNEIYGVSHMAVSINGNDNLFEYNYVHDVCTNTDDAGALYKGRNPSRRGNIIRYNYWRDIGNPAGSGTAAIYFDDGDGGDIVVGNVFLRCGYPASGHFGAIFSHGGHGNVAANNIFIDCTRALGSTPWDDQRWKDAIAGPDWQNKLLKEVDITAPPYTTHYPALVGFTNGQPSSERLNLSSNNLLVRCNLPNNGNWTNLPTSMLILTNDPGFVDFARGDLRLKPDSEVFKRLPGFRPIPFDKIGLEK